MQQTGCHRLPPTLPPFQESITTLIVRNLSSLIRHFSYLRMLLLHYWCIC